MSNRKARTAPEISDEEDLSKFKDPHRPTRDAVIKAVLSEDIETVIEKLTEKQRLFCKEYIVDFNAKAATIRAGYSENYADRHGHNLLKNHGVQFYIKHLIQQNASKIMSVNPDYVLRRTVEIIEKEGTNDSAKLKGLEMLFRHLGMFHDKTELTGKDGGAIEVEQRTKQEASEFTSLISNLRDRAAKKTDVKTDVTLV